MSKENKKILIFLFFGIFIIIQIKYFTVVSEFVTMPIFIAELIGSSIVPLVISFGLNGLVFMLIYGRKFKDNYLNFFLATAMGCILISSWLLWVVSNI